MNEISICDFTIVETRGGFYVYDDDLPFEEAIVIKTLDDLAGALRDEGYTLLTIEMVSISLLETGEAYHSHLDDTTYVVRTADGFAVCDNGEEVAVSTAEAAARVVVENASRL